MISVSTFACVLALGAVAGAALLWITSLRREAALESRLSTTVMSLRTVSAKLVTLEQRVSRLNATAPAGLAAQVVELSDAVARLAKTQQRFAGKFYAEGGENARGSDPSYASVSQMDPELAAELALQNAPAVAPGKTR